MQNDDHACAPVYSFPGKALSSVCVVNNLFKFHNQIELAKHESLIFSGVTFINPITFFVSFPNVSPLGTSRLRSSNMVLQQLSIKGCSIN